MLRASARSQVAAMWTPLSDWRTLDLRKVNMSKPKGTKKQPLTVLPDPLPKLLVMEEAALLLRISVSTLYDWVSERRIPFRKSGRITVFDRDEILEWTKPKAA
jgi:excisionase family DNA binding protein